MFRNKRTLVLGLSLFALLIGGILSWRTNSASSSTSAEEFRQGVRNALAEINLPTGSNRAIIDASSGNLANFIYYRSGVQLSQPNKILLSENEQKSWEQSKRVTQSQLAQILTEVSFDKLVTLSDSDINNMSETLRGFNASGLSSTYAIFRSSVRPRSNGEGLMEPEYFISQIKSIRDSEITCRLRNSCNSDLTLRMSRTALNSRITNEFATRAKYLADADPNFFGNTNSDMTPMEALLLTYSIVADDGLDDNQSGLQTRMADAQQVIFQHWGEQYPSPQSYRAFGVNGYWYSSPVNLLLDDATTTRVINLVKERGGLQ